VRVGRLAPRQTGSAITSVRRLTVSAK